MPTATDPRHARLTELFLAACERPAEERDRFLAEACGDDEELRREVESLLGYRQATGDAADAASSSVTPLWPAAGWPAAGEPPQQIGHYRLLQKLGEGGMGEVWEAEQERPVRRRVALKLIKWGMDTREVVARFESERQAMALMDHPAIARVFEAGATAEGRPYFAMELVQGIPITDYCDTHRLTTDQRLALFIEVCQGVQHAHQKGVIHRDLKPSNVLVTLRDGEPAPKIIDFGVAKATAQRLTERTLFTELGQWVGTPEYMSPEQAEMSGLDIDTRSDVYSLGAVLYELLAGAQPFVGEELRRAGFDEMRRTIREQEPPRPSTRVSTAGEGSGVAAERRRTDPAALVRELSGDLDWITMKALEKDRTRRYGSPAELAADLERHRRYEPVTASPPSALYRAKKFVRRHRLGVAAAALVAAALVLGIAGTALGFLWASREAEAARQVSESLVAMFDELDPTSPESRPVTVENLLARGVERVDRQLGDQPLVAARLRTVLGRTYCNLGRYGEALPLLEDAREIQRELLGPQHPELALTLNSLAVLRRETGDYEAAEGLVRQALEIRRQAFGEEHPDVAESLRELALVLGAQGDYETAEALIRQVLAMRQRLFGEEHPDVADSLSDVATAAARKGDYEAAEPLFREVLAMRRRLFGEEHPDVADSLSDLAWSLVGTGDREAAGRLYRESLAIHRRLFGEDHPRVAGSLVALGWSAYQRGDREAAERLFRDALALHRRLLGEDHPNVATSLYGLGWSLVAKRDYEAAEPLFRQALALDRRFLGEEHPSVALNLASLAWSAKGRGDHEAAERLYREALALQRRTLGEEHVTTARTQTYLAQLLCEHRRYAEAEPLLLNAYSVVQQAQDRQLRDLALQSIISLYDGWGRPRKAAEYRALLPPDVRAASADMNKQRQTVTELRRVGTAFMSWLTDQVGSDAVAGAPPAGQDRKRGWTARMKSETPHSYSLITYAMVRELLVPSYIDAVPEKDGWGHPYQFALNADLRGSHVLGLRSAGRDGRFETDDYLIGSFVAAEFDRDLVWGDGYFIRWPAAEATDG